MWAYLARLILRRRNWNLGLILALTVFMAYHARKVSLSYEMTQMLPENDSTKIIYNQFKQRFGEDGRVIFIGIRNEKIFQLETFNQWYDLTETIQSINGVEGVLSISRIYNLVKNDSLQKFEIVPVFTRKPHTQQELDSILKVLFTLPFYQGLLYNPHTSFTMMAVTLNNQVLNTRERVGLIYRIRDAAEEFGQNQQVQVHFSGLPYIRTITANMIEKELIMFILLGLAVASVILLIFFRNWKIVAATMMIVSINVIWLLGYIQLFGYRITALTGILPPLLIVIVVENCIFLLNKYHHEIRKHGNKIKALSRVVIFIGNANLLTNTTTAAGFAAFIITGNKVLTEFGLVASVSILTAYLLTLFLIPIFFSYLPPPSLRHTLHLEKSFASKTVEKVVNTLLYHRNLVYLVTIIFVGAGLYGISLLKTTGNIVDDVPHHHPLYTDLLFFEENIKGVMPLEISIDTHKKRGVIQPAVLQKIDQLQQILAEYPELSRSLSVVEVVKFARQAFYGGKPEMYGLPGNHERAFIFRYIPDLKTERRTILHAFVDSSLQVTRISVQMANIGTKDIQRITEELTPRIRAIFPPDQYRVDITGTSIIFLMGTRYLIRNLITSLILALIVITILMALLFTSPRMIVISMIPNLIPQIMTAALMGYLSISVKPSTILIFSIALGISVDNAIHFLSRYRLHLRLNEWFIRRSVFNALRETGFSMIYSSLVLFFGFIIFTLSSFGGTEALGYLIAFTLLVALLSNLFVLPSLLLTMDKFITTKAFSEPLLEIFDEEIDIELDELQIEPADTRGSA